MNKFLNSTDRTYLEQIKKVYEFGRSHTDRTGVGTHRLFGLSAEYDLAQGFPLIQCKEVWWKGVVEELLWFISGEDNIRSLQEAGVTIWDEWADVDGYIGPGYGCQWRNFNGDGFDQLKMLIDNIRESPDSRRHILTAWNPLEIDDMALPPCHVMAQFQVENGYLNCAMFQRSADMFLGVPFNIASYGLLTSIIAKIVGLEPGKLVHFIGDAHIYDNHRDQVKTLLRRMDGPTEAYPFCIPMSRPRVRIDPSITDIDAFTAEDIILEDYHPLAKIPAPVAV